MDIQIIIYLLKRLSFLYCTALSLLPEMSDFMSESIAGLLCPTSLFVLPCTDSELS